MIRSIVVDAARHFGFFDDNLIGSALASSSSAHGGTSILPLSTSLVTALLRLLTTQVFGFILTRQLLLLLLSTVWIILLLALLRHALGWRLALLWHLLLLLSIGRRLLW